MNFKNFILLTTIVFLVILISEVFLFLSGSKILVEETEVKPGDYLISDELSQIFGNRNESVNALLLCKYFNGRKVVFRKYEYSPINEGGKDACPAFLRPRQ